MYSFKNNVKVVNNRWTKKRSKCNMFTKLVRDLKTQTEENYNDFCSQTVLLGNLTRFFQLKNR